MSQKRTNFQRDNFLENGNYSKSWGHAPLLTPGSLVPVPWYVRLVTEILP